MTTGRSPWARASAAAISRIDSAAEAEYSTTVSTYKWTMPFNRFFFTTEHTWSVWGRAKASFLSQAGYHFDIGTQCDHGSSCRCIGFVTAEPPDQNVYRANQSGILQHWSIFVMLLCRWRNCIWNRIKWNARMQWPIQKFWKGEAMAAEDNGVSALSFIANELNAFYTGKGDLLYELLRPMVAAAASPTLYFPFNPPLHEYCRIQRLRQFVGCLASEFI